MTISHSHATTSLHSVFSLFKRRFPTEKKHIVSVSVSDFKVHCLAYLESARRESAQYIITKRGTPIAMVAPITATGAVAFGQMSGTASITGDIMAPIDIEWSENAD